MCIDDSLIFPYIFLNGVILADSSLDKMDGQTRLFLQQYNASDEPEFETVSIEEARQNLAKSIIPSPIRSLSISEIKIPSAQMESPLRIYTP